VFELIRPCVSRRHVVHGANQRARLRVRLSSFRPPPPVSLLHFPLNTSFLMAAVAQYPMPPPTADLATTWAFLEEGVDHIMTKLHTGVSYTKYMNLYTVSYNYCTSSKMHSASASEQSVAGRCLSFFTPWPHHTDISPQPVLI
jgi:hypothetical protein